MSKSDSDIFGIKAIIQAGKGSIDFIAFALIACLTVLGLTQGLDLLQASGIAVVLAAIWVLMRYALLALQSRERLQKLRESATLEARTKLQHHATEDEMRDLFGESSQGGGENGN